MNVKLLVDAIMRQTTVLVAQLSTAAGVRAPLAHVADQVFWSLAREIEAQGVGKKVVADMFGMALRSYQRKLQRLAEGTDTQGKTLFEALLEFVENRGGATRAQVLARFARDGERETIGVLTDLVHSGLLYTTGVGDDVLYGVTSDAERQRLTRGSDDNALCDMAWGAIYRTPDVTQDALLAELGATAERLERALERLTKDGRVTRDDRPDGATYRASTFQIPLDAGHGWESAVFDHFQALATALSTKVRARGTRADREGVLGGSTFRFELHPSHPHKARVLGQLRRLREETTTLWELVSDYNDEHPIDDPERFNVCLYFGQTVDDLDQVCGKAAAEEDVP